MRRLFWALLALAAASVGLSAKDWSSQTFTLTANGQCVQLDVGGMGTASWEITGAPSWTGTISMYVRGKNATANALDVAKADTPSTFVNSTTANGIWSGPVASYQYAVACATAAMTGTAIVQLSAAGTGGGSGGGGGGGGGVVEGMGTAGTPAGGLLTVQGAPSMTPLQVESNSLSLATQTTALAIQSATELSATRLQTLIDALSVDVTFNNAVIATGPQVMFEAKTIDGSALPNPVTEGFATRPAASIAGVALTTITDPAGLIIPPIVKEDDAETGAGGLMAIGCVRRDVAASSAGTTGDNTTCNSDALGQQWTRQLDPCSGVAKTFLPISIATATTTEITPSLAGASNNYYVCSINLVASAAENVAIVDDDSDGCGSVTSGMNTTGTTAAVGWNFTANGGIALGDGMSSIMKTNGTNRVVCAVTSSTAQLSGTMVVVAAP